MTKSYLIPQSNRETVEARCLIVWLEVGTGGKHRFALQFDGKDPSLLCDYRTGYRIASLNAAAVSLMATRGPAAFGGLHSDWRKLAQDHIHMLVASRGETFLRDRLAAPPTVNR